jgi:glutaredoxin
MKIFEHVTKKLAALDRRLTLWLFIAVIMGVVSVFSPDMTARADAQNQITPTPINDKMVIIYLFWGDGCPHCAAAKPFLEGLTRQYPNAVLRPYEVWYNESNQALMWKMTAAYGFKPSGVPTIFIGSRHWVGYSDIVRDEIAATVAECSQFECRDAGAGIAPPLPTPTPIPTQIAATPESILPGGSDPARIPLTSKLGATGIISIPLIGTVDLTAHSLTVSTLLIAFVDGFNPCSLWVLSILLALTLHTGSRKKVFLVGIVFLTVTSFIYMLFILGLFTMFTVISFVGWIQVVVALAALFFAAVNIKDYLWYKEGISFTIADEKKPGIYKGIRRVMDAGDSMWGLIGATIVLSAGVSLVEFSCTAGFPVLWTNLLITQEAAALTFAALLLLYMFIYQIDELGIFLAAVFTLKASKLEEKYGRILKLIGGMLMFTLAVVMLVNPAWMNQITSSLLVFVVAFGLTALALALHRYILPRFGIYLGSEFAPPARKKGTHRLHHRHV